MTSLKKLYEAMNTLREAGISISEDLERQASELEENIIKKDILPVIKQAIEPALSPVQREVVIVVDYKPDEPISVSLSRKTNINKLINAKPLETCPTENPKHKSINIVPQKERRAELKLRNYANANEIMRKFVKFMRNLKHKESTVSGYTNALQNHIPRYISKVYNNSNQSTFSYTDVNEVREIYTKLDHNRDFQIVNDDMHHEMSAALKKYIHFLEVTYL